MNLELEGSRNGFYQWDTGQQLVITGADTCKEIHFCHTSDERALVCRIREEDGKRVVDVPNILLQKAEMLIAYAYEEGEGHRTLWTKSFAVKPRPRPEAYVYTQTEVLSYGTLADRLEILEGEGLANAVAEYLKDHPVQAGATAEEAAQILQNKESIEKLADSKLDVSGLPGAVEDALNQAKQSGVFKGEPGDDYVLTEADKTEIAEQAAQLVEIPSGSNQPLTFTGAVNATYDGSEPVSVEIPVGGGNGGGSDRLVAKYVHTKNKVIQPTSLDLETGVFTCVGHGLKTGDEAIVINDYGYQYIPFELLSTSRASIGSPSVRVIDADTFVLQYGGTDLVYPHEANTTIDVSKWHIEIPKAELLILNGFSEELIEVRIHGFYWGTNNYSIGLRIMENGSEINSRQGNALKLALYNGSTICPFVSGVIHIGQEYEVDVLSLMPSTVLTDYTYIQKWPQNMEWNSRCTGKSAKWTLPLAKHNSITELLICMYEITNKRPIRLANGFTVEVYRRG